MKVHQTVSISGAKNIWFDPLVGGWDGGVQKLWNGNFCGVFVRENIKFEGGTFSRKFRLVDGT